MNIIKKSRKLADKYSKQKYTLDEVAEMEKKYKQFLKEHNLNEPETKEELFQQLNSKLTDPGNVDVNWIIEDLFLYLEATYIFKKLSPNGNVIKLHFLNGQKFRLTVQEIK